MSNLSISRLLGIALIAGGAIVGIVLMVLMSTYAGEGTFTPTTAAIGVIVAFILLVLPQFGLGVYLIWDSFKETGVSPPKPPESE
jgi:hypothetical protein